MDINDSSFVTLKTKCYNSRPIKSLQEYLDYIQYLQNKWNKINLWYRGVSQVSYKLTPSVYRTNMYNTPTAQQQEEICEEFVRRSRSFISTRHDYGTLEWYQTMQHYGLPTRLLDWTEGALIALYFAVRTLSNQTPSVWVLNPHWLNNITVGEDVVFYTTSIDSEGFSEEVGLYINDFKNVPPLPLAILPAYINERIVAQRSCFTIHGSDKDGFSTIFQDHIKDAQLVQLRMDNRVIEYIKDDIIEMGIRETTIFPDLEGLAREIKYEYELFKRNT